MAAPITPSQLAPPMTVVTCGYACLDPLQKGERRAILLECRRHADDGVFAPRDVVENAIQECRCPRTKLLHPVGECTIAVAAEQHLVDVSLPIGSAVSEQVAGEHPLASIAWYRDSVMAV